MNEKEGGFVISRLRLRWNDSNHFLEVEARKHGIREKGVKTETTTKKALLTCIYLLRKIIIEFMVDAFGEILILITFFPRYYSQKHHTCALLSSLYQIDQSAAAV